MSLIGDALLAAVACVAVASLLRLAQFASSKDVEKQTVRQHAVAIARYSGVVATITAVLSLVYMLTVRLFYSAPDLPELAPLAGSPGPRQAVPVQVRPVRPVRPVTVDALRQRMMATVTPRAPPPMKPVLKNGFRHTLHQR